MWRWLLLIVIVTPSYASWENLTATIAVVEYRPLQTNGTPEANAQEYVKTMKSVNKPDLIVFPEATLRTSTKTAVEINKGDNPCTSNTYPQYVKDISCAARDLTTYTVINLVEKSVCAEKSISPNCQKSGFSFYNTDVVFDRNGTIINRYRKYNLFGEFSLDRPDEPESVVIETNFGINFGIFTCFDILFKHPAQDLLERNIQGVIFPTMWFSELPFLTAIQAQQMWAHTHNITLLAAEANNPLVASGGSGVYRGDEGAVISDIVAEGGTRVLIYKSENGAVTPQPPQDVDELASSLDNFKLLVDQSPPHYNSTLLNVSLPSVKTELCHNNLCCRFDVETSLNASQSNLSSYTYHLVAYSGVRSFSGVYNGGIEVCGIIACLDSSLESCGQRFGNYKQVQWPLLFRNITITGAFADDGNRTQFPNSLLSSIRPIAAAETVWTKNGQNERILTLAKPQNRILTFAIFGRNFEWDSLPKTDGDSGSESMSLSLIALCVVSVYHFFNIL